MFARNVTGPLSSLLKQLDAAVAKNKEADLRSVAFFLTDDVDTIEEKIKELAEKEKISENLPLTVVEGSAGPPLYRINQEAELTVMLYRRGKVESNFAFKSGELDEKKVKAIVADLPKILPTKEELEEQAKKKNEEDQARQKRIEELKKKLEEQKKKDKDKEKDKGESK